MAATKAAPKRKTTRKKSDSEEDFDPNEQIVIQTSYGEPTKYRDDWDYFDPDEEK